MNIVMEYCNSGDLAVMIHHARQKHEFFTEKQIMFWFIQILLAVGYLHELRIIHRDIKPSNIFLTVNHKVIKLGDFGVTRKLGSSTEYAATVIGTPLYMAPELILSEPYSTKSDVWSLGILLYELCELNTPFGGASILQISTDIINGQLPPLTPNKYNEDMYSLISTMLNKDPETRVSILTIMTCPLITTYLYEFIKEYGNDEILQSIGIMNNEELITSSNTTTTDIPTVELKPNNTTDATGATVVVTSDEKGLLESCCKLCIPFLVTPNSSFDVSNSFNPNASSADMGSLDESNASEIGKDMFLKSQDPKSSNESTPNPTYNNRISLMKKLSIVDPDNIIKPRRKSNLKSPPQNQQLKQKQKQNDTSEQLIICDSSCSSNSNSNSNTIVNRPVIDSDSPLSPIQQKQQQQQQIQISLQLQETVIQHNHPIEEQEEEEEKYKEEQSSPPQEVIVKENEMKVEETKEMDKEEIVKDVEVEEETKCEIKYEDILSPHSPLKQKDGNGVIISPRPMNFKSPIVTTKAKSSPISDEHKSYQTVIKPNIENESKIDSSINDKDVIVEEKINEEIKIDLPLSQYEDIIIKQKQKQKQNKPTTKSTQPTIKTDEELLKKQQRIEERRKRRLQKQNRRNEESKLSDDIENDNELDFTAVSPNIPSPSYPIQILKQQEQEQTSSSSPLTTKPSPIKSPLIELMKKNQLINNSNSNSGSGSDNNSTKTPSPNDISPRKLNPIRHLSPRYSSSSSSSNNNNNNITPITNHLIPSPYSSNLSPRQIQLLQQQQQPPPPPPSTSNSSLSMYKSPPSNQRHIQSYHSTPSHLPSLQSTPLSIASSKSSKSLLQQQQQYSEIKKKKSSPIKTSDEMIIRGNPLKGVHNNSHGGGSGDDNGGDSKVDDYYNSENIIDTENERRFNEEIFYMNNKKPLKKTNSFNDYKKKKQRDKNRPYSAPFEAVTAINQIRIEARQVISSLGQR